MVEHEVGYVWGAQASGSGAGPIPGSVPAASGGWCPVVYFDLGTFSVGAVCGGCLVIGRRCGCLRSWGGVF